MIKAEIIEALRESHRKFTGYIMGLDEKSFLFSLKGEKWTAGQQLDHIYRSIHALNNALRLPKWIIRIVFGKANRPSRAYEGLVDRYHQKLGAGGRASGRFVPNGVDTGERLDLKDKIDKEILLMEGYLDKFTESDLDRLILPHPLLGKLTLREMMYFTIYHAEHHLNNTIGNLKSMSLMAR